jgi:hypothetical protein
MEGHWRTAADGLGDISKIIEHAERYIKSINSFVENRGGPATPGIEIIRDDIAAKINKRRQADEKHRNLRHQFIPLCGESHRRVLAFSQSCCPREEDPIISG